jgi:hypothetical protein
VAVGAPVEDRLEKDDPGFVDLEVASVAKGHVTQTRVRIWNLWAGSSCGGALRALSAGSTAAFALETAPRARSQARALWELLGSKVASQDFVLATICGEAMRPFGSKEEASDYVGKRRR